MSKTAQLLILGFAVWFIFIRGRSASTASALNNPSWNPFAGVTT